jgi:hypothetical protein
MMNKLISPEIEHDYMLNNSKLSISLGFGLGMLAIDEALKLSDQSTAISSSYFIVTLCAVIATAYFLLRSNKFMQLTFSKNTWTGTYNDEFLNTVNLIAYKVTAMGMTILASTAMVFGNTFNEIITLKTFGTLLVALLFLIYGLVTFFKLNQDDEA